MSYTYAFYRCGREASTPWHGEVMLRYRSKDREDHIRTVPHTSKVYYEKADGNFTSVYGKPVAKMEFDNIFTKKRWKTDYNIRRTYGEFAPEMEFIQDSFFGMNENPDFFSNELRIAVVDIETAIKRSAGPESFDTNKTVYPINLISVYDNFDECTHVFMWISSKWYNKPQSEWPWKNSKKVKYLIYTDYAEMLKSFMIWWKKNRPDVVTGWNLKLFDMPYIITECYKLFSSEEDRANGVDIVANHFSPMGVLTERHEKAEFNEDRNKYYEIAGVNTLDYRELYRDNYGKKSMPNYKLETIAQAELGVGKLQNPAKNFYEFYTQHWETFVEYNIIDVQRVWELELKLRYINLAKTIAYTSLIPIEKVTITTPVVMGALNQEVKRNDRIMITSTGNEDPNGEDYEGAIVLDPQVGIYSNGIFSIDLNSLYPNIMITVNISNETFVGKIIHEDDNGVQIRLNGKTKNLSWQQFNTLLKPKVTRAANGALFLKHSEKVGVIPQFLQKTYNDRKSIKGQELDAKDKISKLKDALSATDDNDRKKQIKDAIAKLTELSKQYNAGQTAKKLLMNSLYGLFANQYSPIFNVDLAEAITLSGQTITKGSSAFVNKYANEQLAFDGTATIYGDTDSIYINGEPFIRDKFGAPKWTKEAVQEYCDYLDRDVIPLINANCAQIAKTEFWSDKSTIEFKRETMCSHGAFIAKKRYCLLVRNDEGAAVKKWKYVGMSQKKNEFTSEVKKMLMDLTERMIIEDWNDQQFNDAIYEAWETFQQMKPEQIGIIKGYNTKKEYYGGFRCEPGTLAQVRGLHYHNDLIKQFDLGLPEISLNDKFQFVYLIAVRNRFQIDAIGFDFEWPEKFSEEFEIDYKEMFDKIIIKPLLRFIQIKHFSVPNVKQKEVFNINDL